MVVLSQDLHDVIRVGHHLSVRLRCRVRGSEDLATHAHDKRREKGSEDKSRLSARPGPSEKVVESAPIVYVKLAHFMKMATNLLRDDRVVHGVRQRARCEDGVEDLLQIDLQDQICAPEREAESVPRERSTSRARYIWRMFNILNTCRVGHIVGL